MPAWSCPGKGGIHRAGGRRCNRGRAEGGSRALPTALSAKDPGWVERSTGPSYRVTGAGWNPVLESPGPSTVNQLDWTGAHPVAGRRPLTHVWLETKPLIAILYPAWGSPSHCRARSEWRPTLPHASGHPIYPCTSNRSPGLFLPRNRDLCFAMVAGAVIQTDCELLMTRGGFYCAGRETAPGLCTLYVAQLRVTRG